MRPNSDECLLEPTDLIFVFPRAVIGTQGSLQEGCGGGGRGRSHSEHRKGLGLLLLEEYLSLACTPAHQGSRGMSCLGSGWRLQADSPRVEAPNWGVALAACESCQHPSSSSHTGGCARVSAGVGEPPPLPRLPGSRYRDNMLITCSFWACRFLACCTQQGFSFQAPCPIGSGGRGTDPLI